MTAAGAEIEVAAHLGLTGMFLVELRRRLLLEVPRLAGRETRKMRPTKTVRGLAIGIVRGIVRGTATPGDGTHDTMIVPNLRRLIGISLVAAVVVAQTTDPLVGGRGAVVGTASAIGIERGTVCATGVAKGRGRGIGGGRIVSVRWIETVSGVEGIVGGRV